MDRSKRIHIITEDERLKQFFNDKMSELDKEMHRILMTKHLSDEEKAPLYLQVLQKYVTFPFPQRQVEIEEDPIEEPIKIEDPAPITPIRQEEPIKQEEGDMIQDVVISAPVKSKTLSRKIIDFILSRDMGISWSPHKELMVNGKIIPNTNVITLINQLLRDRKKKPKGFDVFYELLRENGLPHEYVINRYLKRSHKNVRMYAKRLSLYNL